MTTTDYAILTAWAIMLCALWCGVFVLVPRQLRSMFRHRLWALRDDAVDAMRSGELPHNEVTSWFVECVQRTIAHSKHWTFFRWLLWPIPPKQERDLLQEFVDEGRRQLNDQQRALFKQYESRYRGILAKQLFFGSVSGWIALAIACASIPLVVPVLILKRSLSRARNLCETVLQSTVGDAATASVRLRVYDCA